MQELIFLQQPHKANKKEHKEYFILYKVSKEPGADVNCTRYFIQKDSINTSAYTVAS